MLYPTNHYSTLLSNMVPLSGFVLSPHTAIEWVTLSVSSLEDSIKFYKDVLGLRHLFDTGDKAVLGTRSGTPLVVLVRKPGALPKPDNRRGLYHFALLMPSRKDLARMMVRLAKLWEIDGASDHLVSEAIYLRDPDGHGIEIYADRPRLSWRLLDGQRVYMATLPLNIDSLLSELGSEEEKEAVSGGWEMPAEAKIGHIHLHVSRLGRALRMVCLALSGFRVGNGLAVGGHYSLYAGPVEGSSRTGDGYGGGEDGGD
jgi:catechol 2,3-dioxygenase